MENAILFPNLHITLHNVGKTISIGNFTIAYYGIIIAIGMLLGVSWVLREAKRTGQSEDEYLDLCIWGLVFGVLGARLYYVAFRWQEYAAEPLQILNIRGGGLAIYGGVIGAVLTIFVMTKVRKKVAFLDVLDLVAMGALIGQIIGRWGNFFNREVFGEYTDNLLAMQLPINAIRSMDDVSPLMMEHLVEIEGVTFIQVAPTFLYESLWNVGVLIVILLLRKHRRFRGELFLVYLLGYGLGRFWIEGVRTDQLYLWNTQIPVSQALALVLVIVSLIFLIPGFLRHRKGEMGLVTVAPVKEVSQSGDEE